MSHSSEPVSVCLLVGSSEIADWYADALAVMEKNTNAELEYVVITDRQASSFTDNSNRTVIRPSSLIKSAFSTVISGVLDTRSQTKVPLEECEPIGNAIEYQCTPQTHGDFRVAIPEEMTTVIDDKCDVILHYGVGILTGEILQSTQHGVMSYHHGNLREYRGGPPGFWEFMDNCSTAGVTLQRLSETLDGGEIIVEKEIDISDARSWNDVSNRMCAASVDMLATGIKNLQDPSYEPTKLSDSDLGVLHSTDDLTTRIKIEYALMEIRRRLTAALIP